MTRSFIIALIVVLLLVLLGSVYTLPEWQQAIVVQLGSPVGAPVTAAGLHFKMPLIQKVYFFDRRVLEWDGDPEVIPTKDSKFIFVDTYARWQISNALTFYKKVANESGAQGRLDDILDGLVRDTLSAHTLPEIVRSSNRSMVLGEEAISAEETALGDSGGQSKQDVVGLRGKLTEQIIESAQKKLNEQGLGIRLIDLRIKRLNYTKKVLQKVYDRMISQQLRIAEKYRALGQGKKAEIAGQVTEESKRINSEAYRKSQKILGEGEATATRIYAEAYQRDPEFYRLVETLKTYERTMNDKGVLMLSTDSELYRYLSKLR
ncbi:MAG: protease modulator HflC [Acidobacteria bacterium]|nr:protease modulator HflC [Acidobacteriota bacterium]